MSLKKFRNQLSYILLFSKLAVIIVLALHYLQHKFLPYQAKELLLIILPLFIVYLTVSFASNRNIPEGVKLSMEKPIILLCKWIPIAFAIYMILVMTFLQSGTSGDGAPFRQMKDMIGGAEVIFGFYIGFIFQILTKNNFNTITDQDHLLLTLKQLQTQLKGTKESIIPDIDKATLKQQLGKGKIQEVITTLTDSISTNTEATGLLNQVIQLSGQYHKYNEQKRLNLIDSDVLINQVTHNLLQVIDEL